MSLAELKNAVEAVLFAVGEPVKAVRLADALSTTESDITAAVAEINREAENGGRGIMIIEIDGGYQVCSNPSYHGYIREILGEQRRQALSNAAMEALAIVAYNQPVTRAQVERIRGVNSDGAINRLLERGLIDESGRLDAPGRPVLYATTDVFLRCFGFKTLAGLPDRESSVFEQITLDENL